MSNNSSYRDSYFQYQHLVLSHHILYNEWDLDEFLALDEQEAIKRGDSANTDGELEGSSSSNNKGNVMQHVNDDTYWDSFDEEADWAVFSKAQLDTRGMATFQAPTADAVTPPVTGSIFDGRTLQQARARVIGWHEAGRGSRASC
ncbi:hypothetical protein NCAS_0A08010 [Naumovozyma castellii]|uniref:Uncharacterized protein n=1 Tax=Naumovozyma castellii TaxID=27288 RepID=G0V7B1_NAUCA|nr:hypothetical protein NCAS_0A08010 [Naumovozyma castellii CBS 4309]CCC67359.1 hypothetical protein NCAS_0A08010 [Naumovozyma castellii CBS 4309]